MRCVATESMTANARLGEWRIPGTLFLCSVVVNSGWSSLGEVPCCGQVGIGGVAEGEAQYGRLSECSART
ncbi:hypothetical protein SAMN05421805_10753 [Saccharopolyspora antimicrobica]|uniref:Uncharacterized protein n=1 Tax=Saccharopolyspora antimicrobica TaxID=455193 RepID=A0A1I5C3W8_9PSEU|nr:hypothetical protein ATL45_7428 [Saccharopolyspora antimicrobica]SFN81566.1 hypothetical protein SAMN05421805_10753 [Saccharopolyspora antimicrobica]